MKKEKRKAKAYIALKKESNVARELELWELQGAKNGDMFFPPSHSFRLVITTN